MLDNGIGCFKQSEYTALGVEVQSKNHREDLLAVPLTWRQDFAARFRPDS
jgi:hypothetical protein